MEYWLEFHWWYPLVGGVVLFAFLGESKGGTVVRRLVAHMNIVDDRFENCRPEAEYKIFEEGVPDKIDIEIEKLSIAPGETLELFINQTFLASIRVRKGNRRQAQFEHWSDEGVEFPVIHVGDDLRVKYKSVDVLHGVFELDR